MNFYEVLEALSSATAENYKNVRYAIGLQQYDAGYIGHIDMLATMLNDTIFEDLLNNTALLNTVIQQIYHLKEIHDVKRYITALSNRKTISDALFLEYFKNQNKDPIILNLLLAETHISSMVDGYFLLDYNDRKELVKKLLMLKEHGSFLSRKDKHFYIETIHNQNYLILSKSIQEYPHFCFEVLFKDVPLNVTLHHTIISELESLWTGPEGRKLLLAFARSTSRNPEEENWQQMYHFFGFEAAEQQTSIVSIGTEISLHI